MADDFFLKGSGMRGTDIQFVATVQAWLYHLSTNRRQAPLAYSFVATKTILAPIFMPQIGRNIRRNGRGTLARLDGISISTLSTRSPAFSSHRRTILRELKCMPVFL
jgi:hypothetical protein